MYNRCKAIIISGKNSGKQCNRFNTILETERCIIHHNSIVKHGVPEISRRESQAQQLYNEEVLLDDYVKGRIDYNTYENTLNNYTVTLVEDDGIDYKRIWLMEKYNRRIVRINDARLEVINRQQQLLDEYQRALPINLNQNMQDFVNDKQNVHTRIVVNQTSEIVKNILNTINVPDDFKWSDQRCSKTPGDIIITCELSPNSVFQMMSKYCSNETIYELESGVYGKTLDAVWQFILKSDDKINLISILKQELEDNIGMCAQGNLSRLCNILAGYLSCITNIESISEILGREFSKLMETIDDEKIRIAIGNNILNENNVVDEKKRKEWINSLI